MILDTLKLCACVSVAFFSSITSYAQNAGLAGRGITNFELVTASSSLTMTDISSTERKSQTNHELIGIASFYGDEFHGRLAANGEIFDNTQLVAAHKTLPFGTLVKVIRKDNAKSVTVRIIDRGPFKPGRIIDLSQAAAVDINLVRDGLAEVSIEVLTCPVPQMAANPAIATIDKNAPKPSTQISIKPNSSKETVILVPPVRESEVAHKPVAAKNIKIIYVPQDDYGVQIAAYADFKLAEQKVNELFSQGITNALIHQGTNISNQTTIFRVIVGPYEEIEMAQTELSKDLGAKGLVINMNNLR